MLIENSPNVAVELEVRVDVEVFVEVHVRSRPPERSIRRVLT
jgi:hypothetical protein